jgi:glycosyltransferase involved in cell wall biosynthesis
MNLQPPQSSLSCGDAALPMISFIVKTYNEEAKIAACLESILAAAHEVPNPCEIIVADSVSADRTVEIAKRYAVSVVQFANPKERGCGAGVQLGFQHSRGEWVFIIDGDMTLAPGFLAQALAHLTAHPQLAGVSGVLVDTAVRNTFDHYRVVNEVGRQARAEKSLGGGGVYRRSAIARCGGYAANQNLKGWEESELGMRLLSTGYGLERLGVAAIHHTGHNQSTWRVLHSLWRSRRAMSSGVLIKQAWPHAWRWVPVRMMAAPLCLTLWWGLFGISLAWGLGSGQWLMAQGLFAALALGFTAFALRKKSLRHAFMSFGLWHFHAASILLGLFEPTVDPTQAIQSRVLKGSDSI